MELVISDHALVRFIERYRGESLDMYREEIRALLAANKTRPIPDHGFDDGYLFLIDRLCSPPMVISVLAPGMRPKRSLIGEFREGVHVPNDTAVEGGRVDVRPVHARDPSE